MLNST